MDAAVLILLSAFPGPDGATLGNYATEVKRQCRDGKWLGYTLAADVSGACDAQPAAVSMLTLPRSRCSRASFRSYTAAVTPTRGYVDAMLAVGPPARFAKMGLI